MDLHPPEGGSGLFSAPTEPPCQGPLPLALSRKLSLLILLAFGTVVGVQAVNGIRREIAVYDASARPDGPEERAQRSRLVRRATIEHLTAAATYLVFAGIATTLLMLAFVTLPARRLAEQASAEQRLAVDETKRRMADTEELQDANRLATVAHLAASVAHELGTPLGVVLARARMIADGLEPTSELRADAEVIVGQAKRMTLMIAEVLDLSRARPPVHKSISLDAVVAHAVALLLPMTRQAHVRLHIESTPPDARHRVSADESRLLQIISNLVINAKQATTTKGTITLRVDRRDLTPPAGEGRGPGSYVCLEVSDEGTGIRPADVPRVFDTFFTTKKEGEGTGLGLSVSLRLARAHGGWLDVTSTVGRGSCFTLYLPELSSSVTGVTGVTGTTPA